MNEPVPKKGIRNAKNLLKWDSSDWFWTFFFIALLFSVWGYKRDVQICRAYVEEHNANWMNITNGTGELKTATYSNIIPVFNFSLANMTTSKNMTTSNGT